MTFRPPRTETSHEELAHAISQRKHALELPGTSTSQMAGCNGTQICLNPIQPAAGMLPPLLSLFKPSDDRPTKLIAPATQQLVCKSRNQSFLTSSFSSSSRLSIGSENSLPATQDKIAAFPIPTLDHLSSPPSHPLLHRSAHEPRGARSSPGLRGPSTVGSSRICSARKEMQGSCLGMVVGMVVGIMWF